MALFIESSHSAHWVEIIFEIEFSKIFTKVFWSKALRVGTCANGFENLKKIINHCCKITLLLHRRQTIVDGAKFWSSRWQLNLLRNISYWHLLQNSVLSTNVWRQLFEYHQNYCHKKIWAKILATIWSKDIINNFLKYCWKRLSRMLSKNIGKKKSENSIW